MGFASFFPTFHADQNCADCELAALIDHQFPVCREIERQKKTTKYDYFMMFSSRRSLRRQLECFKATVELENSNKCVNYSNTFRSSASLQFHRGSRRSPLTSRSLVTPANCQVPLKSRKFRLIPL
jgi:hypothetical protein